jgi:hypothetical protein
VHVGRLEIVRRLCTPEAIKCTAWLCTDWEAVAAKKAVPPFAPQFEGPNDLRNFDDFEDFDSFDFTVQNTASTDTDIDQVLFKEF